MKLANWIGVAALAGALIGCSSSPTTSGAPAATGSPAASAAKLRIGVSIPAADHGWTAGVKWWSDEAAKMYPNAEFTIMTAKDPAEQTSQIESMLTKGVDGMVILATESAAMTPVAKKVKEAGVFIVNVDRGFTETGLADIFVEGDNKAFGRKAAEYFNEKMPSGGKILVLEGISSTVNTDRVNAFKSSLNPNIVVAGQQPGEWNRETAYKVTQTMLVANKDITGIWASDDDMALGVIKALEEANMTNVWILGGGGMKDVVKRVMDKDAQFPATITYSPSMIATGIHLCVSTMEGGMKDKRMEFMPRHLLIDVQTVTPENAADFYFPDSIY
ncbi:MAG: substrate-binding domain-containing protein [Fimbriimonadaceae bacterium]|nr:substrate-binding domain-containing protein [Fimbriimonadaceae bacterium]